jgi:hypothetical protein
MTVLTDSVCTFDCIYCVNHLFNLPDFPNSETLVVTALFTPNFGRKWHALKALKSMKVSIYSVNCSAVSGVLSHMKCELIDDYLVS